MAEGKKIAAEVQARDVPLAIGYGKNIWDLNPELNKKIHGLYEDAKVALWAEMTADFISTIPNAVSIKTQATDRENYIAAPPKGEVLSKEAVATLDKMKKAWGTNVPDVLRSDWPSPAAVRSPSRLFHHWKLASTAPIRLRCVPANRATPWPGASLASSTAIRRDSVATDAPAPTATC